MSTPSVRVNDYRSASYVRLTKDGIGRTALVSRLVAKAFLSPSKGMTYPEVWHKDRDTRNNRAKNLMWHDRPKLTEKQVSEIQTTTGRVDDLALKYGVNRSTNNLMQLGKTWQNPVVGGQ